MTMTISTHLTKLLEEEEPYVTTLLRDGVVLLGGRFYKPAYRPDTGRDVLSIGKHSLALEPMESLPRLERMYLEEPSVFEAFMEIQKEYMKVDHRVSLPRNLNDVLVEEKLLSLLIDDVLPFFVSTDSALDDMLREVTGTATAKSAPTASTKTIKTTKKKMFSSGIDDLIGEALGENYIQSSKKEKSFLTLGKSCMMAAAMRKFGLKDICTMRIGPGAAEWIYELQPKFSPDGVDFVEDATITLNKKFYMLVPKMPLSKLLDEYAEQIDLMLKREAMNAKMGISDANLKLEELVSTLEEPQYKEAGIGVERLRHNVYVLSMKVPQFANLGEDGNIYSFPACEVAVKVNATKRSPSAPYKITMNDPYVTGTYLHPFVTMPDQITQGLEEDMHICLDDETIPLEQRASTLFKSYSLGKRIAAYLNHSKQIIMSGYMLKDPPRKRKKKPFDVDSAPRTKLSEHKAHYGQLEKSYGWILKHKMPVTNVSEEQLESVMAGGKLSN